LQRAYAQGSRIIEVLKGATASLYAGETVALLGPSGAGKSTLANALLGDDRQATGDVRASDGRGRHTTVARELLTLPDGALLIDTPGIREVGVWDGTGGAFADNDALAAGCRFADCRHETEPGCAVRGAVDDDRLEAARKLEREQAWVDDRRSAARAREALGRARWREQPSKGSA
jgi:ribosome biogenesis GTPase